MISWIEDYLSSVHECPVTRSASTRVFPTLWFSVRSDGIWAKILVTRYMVLVTVNGNILDYCPTENPFILNSDQSDDPNTNFSVLPIFRFWVFQSIQFSGRISKSPKFVLVRTLIFSWWVIEANKIRMKKGMILCVHMVPCRSCGFPENKSRIETESVEIESRINFLLRWLFVWTFFLFKTDFFQNFFFLEFPHQFHFSQIRSFSQNSPIWFDFSEEARNQF